MITIAQLQKLYIYQKDMNKLTEYTDAINKALSSFSINTTNRIAGFLAQIGVESGQLNAVVENLNYNAAGLMSVFHMSEDLANKYQHNPEAIANYVYANRMGNGDEASGDGWKYRGKGLIQLTGKNNHIAFSKFINKSLDDTIAYLLTPEGGAIVAGWYWYTNNINMLCDNNDIQGMTRKVNGGLNGLADRTSLYTRAKEILGTS